MKKFLAIALALITMLSFCACGSSSKAADYYAKTESASGAAYNASGAYWDDDVAEGAYYDEEAYGGFAADNAVSAGTSAPADGSSTTATINPEKIIYSADAQLETTTFDDTISALTDMIASYGGFIESSSVNGSNYYNKSRGRESLRSANYTIRIPGSVFSTVMAALPALGNVPYTNTYTQNITSQYYDVQARLRAYQAQEDRLIEMMSLAESVEDVIIIEDRLTELRYQIDSLQSSLNNWDRQVSYSTIYLYISEVSEYTPTETVKVTYGEKLAQSVKDGLASVGDFFADFLLWFLEALPTLIILAVIAFVIILIIKKGKAKRKARKAARAAKKAQKKAGADALPAENKEE